MHCIYNFLNYRFQNRMQLLNSSAEKVFLNHEILIILADSYKILDNIIRKILRTLLR